MGDLRIFSTRLSPGRGRIYRAVVIYFAVIFTAMLWPIYSLFGSARPLVLGLPLSLFYLAVLLVISFGVLLALYLWEARTGHLDPDAES